MDCKLQMRSKKATRNAALTLRMAKFYSNLLVFLHKSNPSICHSAIVYKLAKKGKGTTISEYACGNNDSFVLFCSVLFS